MKNKKMTIKDFFESCDILIRYTEEKIAERPNDYNYKEMQEACSYKVIVSWIEELKNQ